MAPRMLVTALLADLRAQELAIETELDQVRLARGDTADDEHDPEGSTLSSDWSRLVGMRDAVSRRIEEAELALARVEAGTYGRCLNCGAAMDPARLEARPAAELCMACA